MNYSSSDHTFMVCAYQQSEYLEELLISLKKQTVKTSIAIATSTPNAHIQTLAEKYGLTVYINTGVKGIAGDWNFALQAAKTPLVTIAHQDDIYEPEYAEKMLKAINHAKQPIIAFSRYAELRNGKKVYQNRLLNVKKYLLFPMKLSKRSIFLRRMSLSFGNAICCPAVTYVRDLILEHPFDTEFQTSLDWNQWERLSKLKGSFAYVDEPLMCHRIHRASTTSEMIENKTRTNEDLELFCRFWPRPIAKLLSKAYSTSEKSNALD